MENGEILVSKKSHVEHILNTILKSNTIYMTSEKKKRKHKIKKKIIKILNFDYACMM